MEYSHPSCIYSPSTANNDEGGIWNIRFNRLGTRLLCKKESHLVVYDLPNWQQPISVGKVELKGPNVSGTSDACCFAGIEDELVISASNDDSLLIWSLPNESQDQNMTVDRSLCVPIGHEETIRSVRSSPDKLTFISCDDAGIIKLWTPNNFHA